MAPVARMLQPPPPGRLSSWYKRVAMKAQPLFVFVVLAVSACSKADSAAPTSPGASAGIPRAIPTSAPAQTSAAAPGTQPLAPESLASHRHPELLDPGRWQQAAPSSYKARFSTSKGDFVIQVHRDWAPNGADRFFNLVNARFYDDVRFYRVKPSVFVQFGISGDPAVSDVWKERGIPDEPRVQSNKRGFVSFLGLGRVPNLRTTRIMVHLDDSASSMFDANGLVPFGQVVEGLEVLERVYSGYGLQPPSGPDERAIFAQGNAYLEDKFPKLDAIKSAVIVP